MHAMATMAALFAAIGATPDGVVLDFSATWCGPCQQMLPLVHRLQQQGYAIRTVDIDREKALAQRFKISSVPTFVLVVGGQERERYVGPLSEAQLRRMAASIPEKSQPIDRVKGERLADSVASKSVATRAPAILGSSSPAMANAKPQAEPVIRANISVSDEPIVSDDPMRVSSRIRVTDSKGLDYGSGTIIYSEPGRAWVLTCGHIFRHIDAQSRIDVDVFSGEQYQRYEGTVLRYDLAKDIGLISIRTVAALPMARIAAEPVESGQHVFSVGCGGGEAPSKLQHRVTTTTGYREDIVECTGIPIQGRSGGGLFTTAGEVVGVCILADHDGRRGLYTGLKTIHWLLKECRLDRMNAGLDSAAELAGADSESTENTGDLPMSEVPQFESDEIGIENDAANVVGNDQSMFAPEFAADEFAPRRDSAPHLPDLTEPNKDGVAAADHPQAANSPVMRASVVAGPSVESLRETLEAAKGAEVVCIIRDPNQPDTASRVVIIHRASERFVADLTGELEHQVQRTSLAVRTGPAPDASSMKSADPPFQRYRRRR